MPGERQIINTFSMRWWRFDHYVIDGAYIRPAAHAKLVEYDLWGEYEKSLGDTTGRSVHHELLAIGDMQYKYSRDPRYCRHERLPVKLRQSILRFVSRWGLLGIAPERIRAIHYATKKDMRDRHSHQVRQGEWQLQSRGPPMGHRWAGGAVAHIGGIEPLQALEEGVVIWDDPHEGHTVSPIEDLLRRYMPVLLGYPKVVPLPAPCSELWWQLYVEPWHEFGLSAGNLHTTLEILNSHRPSTSQTVNWWLGSLGEYGSRWTPRMVSYDGQGITQQWTFQSMLGALGEMCVQDELKGRSARTCASASCSAVFGTSNPRARFCSPKCQNTEGKRARKR